MKCPTELRENGTRPLSQRDRAPSRWDTKVHGKPNGINVPNGIDVTFLRLAHSELGLNSVPAVQGNQLTCKADPVLQPAIPLARCGPHHHADLPKGRKSSYCPRTADQL